MAVVSELSMRRAALEVTKSTVLLRYQFDNLHQAAQHLHIFEGRTILFYGDRAAGLQGTLPVAVGLVAHGVELGVLRGSVLARVENAGGAWLQFPDVRLARKLREGPVDMGVRKHQRYGCDLMVEVRGAGQPCLARLVDVSAKGARLTGLPSLASTGSRIEARLALPQRGWPSALGRADVVRAAGSEWGVVFRTDDDLSRGAVSRLLQLVRASWAAARDHHHPVTCCHRGRVLDPAMPRRLHS